MKRSLALVAVLVFPLVTTASLAQPPGFQQLDKGFNQQGPLLFLDWWTLRAGTLAACPRERLPDPFQAGMVATSRLAYVSWVTRAPGPDRVNFRRSLDGGQTWQPLQQVYVNPNTTPVIVDHAIVAEGHEVFCLWRSDITDVQAGLPSGSIKAAQNVWVSGSKDQGQTWTKPVPAFPLLSAGGSSNLWGGEYIAAAAVRDPVSKNVRVHVATEWGSRNPPGEKPVYTAWEFSGNTLKQVFRVQDVSANGREVDSLALTAKGSTVMICYRDDRSGGNQMYGAFSIDGGKSWTEKLLGEGKNKQINNGAALASMNERCGNAMAIDGNNLYFIWNDRTHGLATSSTTGVHQDNERLVMMYSNDLGKTWKTKVVTTFQVGKADVDEHDICAENGRLIIAVCSDERGRHKSVSGIQGTLTNTPADAVSAGDNLGNGNLNDAVQVFVSLDAGNTFPAPFTRWLSRPSIDDGSVKATQGVTGNSGAATLKGTNFIFCESVKLAQHGNIVHVCWEEHWYNGTWHQGEDLMLCKSTDGGVTFAAPVNATMAGGEGRGFQTQAQATTGRNADVDNPSLAITGNGEAIVGFRFEDPSESPDTSFKDRAWVVSRAQVEIWSRHMDPSMTGFLELRDLPGSQAGHIALVVGTLDPRSTPLNLPGLFGPMGVYPNLVLDPVSNLFLQFRFVFWGTVATAGGKMVYGLAPDTSKLPGGSGQIHVVALTYDLVKRQYVSFTHRGRY